MARRRRGSPLSPAYLVRRRAISKGLLGGNSVWRTVALVMLGRRVLRRLRGAEPEVIYTDQLGQGRLLQIETIDPQTVPKGRRTPRKRS
ncbi:hypothetical protein BH24ACT5_BH24ACT5_31270 [soil metagenome]